MKKINFKKYILNYKLKNQKLQIKNYSYFSVNLKKHT